MRRVSIPYLFISFIFCIGISVAEEDLSAPRFRINVDTVVVRVTVTDPLNRYVVGLQKEHFQLFENKLEQTLTHFSNDNSAVSVGIILDTSGSMGGV